MMTSNTPTMMTLMILMLAFPTFVMGQTCSLSTGDRATWCASLRQEHAPEIEANGSCDCANFCNGAFQGCTAYGGNSLGTGCTITGTSNSGGVVTGCRADGVITTPEPFAFTTAAPGNPDDFPSMPGTNTTNPAVPGSSSSSSSSSSTTTTTIDGDTTTTTTNSTSSGSDGDASSANDDVAGSPGPSSGGGASSGINNCDAAVKANPECFTGWYLNVCPDLTICSPISSLSCVSTIDGTSLDDSNMFSCPVSNGVSSAASVHWSSSMLLTVFASIASCSFFPGMTM